MTSGCFLHFYQSLSIFRIACASFLISVSNLFRILPGASFIWNASMRCLEFVAEIEMTIYQKYAESCHFESFVCSSSYSEFLNFKFIQDPLIEFFFLLLANILNPTLTHYIFQPVRRSIFQNWASYARLVVALGDRNSVVTPLPPTFWGQPSPIFLSFLRLALVVSTFLRVAL